MQRNGANEQILEPVSAYDRVAQNFETLSDRRRAYLARIEQLIISEIPRRSCCLLDVGAGNGMRALRIAQSTSVKNIVLLEPSVEMRRHWLPEVQSWPIRAEELTEKTGQFDIVLCLWNVLGHIFPLENRKQVLRHCARLLSPGGRMFVDVMNRYNAAQYGVFPTIRRLLWDRAHPNEMNGNVKVHWEFSGEKYATAGHVFTRGEFRRMIGSAGLAIEKQFTVNYTTGQICRWKLQGNPLYVLRRQ